MKEYLELEKVLDDSHIITVQTRNYGSLEVVPVEYLANIPSTDVQPVSVIKKLQEHIKQRILETVFNNGGIYGEVAEDIANRIDIWVDEFGRTEND